MSDLIERYVYQVGRYLPGDEKEEIQNELRSLLQDQLEDRYKGAPTQDDVVELLTEFGEPRQMAASYGREQYLVGPDLYPAMMFVLQRGWMWIPPIVVLINVLIAFLLKEEVTLLGLFLDTLFLVVQAVFVFSGIVVLIFALMQHTGFELDQMQQSFDPLELPPIDDPATVEQGEAAAGIAFGIFGLLILTYFLKVGGLTLRFNPSSPGDVLAVPTNWLIVVILTTAGMVIINGLALRRKRWSVGLLLSELVLDVLGAVASYYVFFLPIFGWLFETVPWLTNLPFADHAPLITAVVLGSLSVLDTLTKLFKVVFAGRRDMPSISFQAEG